ncbi:MAG: hypothetical protein O9256_01185 [Rhizobiaceae bacterium]|nr:hypothetical protein [Rhizobiaceae bacterium]MCZ8352364.1 hypothetical protein [Rhizobium sp.]
MNILKLSASALVIRVFGTFIMAANLVFVTRNLALTEVGMFALTSSFLFFGKYLGPLGLDQLALRDLSSSSYDYQHRQTLERKLLVNVTVVSFAVVFFSLCVMILWDIYSKSDYFEYYAIFVYCAVVYVCSALVGVLCGILRARGSVIISIAGDAVVPQLTTLFMLSYFVYFSNLSVEVSCCAVAIGAVMSVLFQFMRLRRYWSGVFFVGTSDVKAFNARDALSVWFFQLLNFGQSRFQIYFASAFLGFTYVALIEVSTKVALVPTMSTWAIGTVIGPKLAKHSRSPEEILKYIIFSVVFGGGVSLTCLVLFYIFGNYILVNVLGSAYNEAYSPSIILLFAVLVNSVGGVFATYLVMSKRESIASFFTGLGLICGVLVALVNTHFGLGATGVAIGAALAIVVRDVGIPVFLVFTKDPVILVILRRVSELLR